MDACTPFGVLFMEDRVPALRRLAAVVVIALLAITVSTSLGGQAGAGVDPEAELYHLTNESRAANGRGPLTYDPGLSAIARAWSMSMAGNGVLLHNPNNVAQVDRSVTSAWRVIGENVGYGPTAAILQQAYMNSPGHRANILDPEYNRVGVGTAFDGSGRLWSTLVFMAAAPIASTPPATPALRDDQGASAASSGPLTTAVVERSSNGTLWWRQANAGVWGSWTPLGGFTAGDPEVTSWGSGRLDVFVIGSDGALWHRGGVNGSWFGWESLGGKLASSPAAVSWAPGRIDAFARGSDGALWTIAWEGSSWTGWRSLGGNIISSPDVTSWGPGRLDVFAAGSDSALWHASNGGGRWSWEGLGGGIAAGPGAAAPAANRLTVFARGTDATLWSRSWTGGGWSPWRGLGGAVNGSPDGVVIGGVATALVRLGPGAFTLCTCDLLGVPRWSTVT